MSSDGLRRDLGVWTAIAIVVGTTIGSAIFDGLFPGAPDVAAQVRHVLEVAARV